jgi:hypothetical protein
MPIEIWQELSGQFQKRLDYCKSSSNQLDCSMIRSCCNKTGKAFFEMITNNEIQLDISDGFRIAPIAEKASHGHEFRDVEHYDLYWLCVLGFMGSTDNIIIANNELHKTKLPGISKTRDVCWLAVHHVYAEVMNYFIDDHDYIQEVCKVSIQLCSILIRKLRSTAVSVKDTWRPPEGYIGAKAIEQDFGIPRSTLEYQENTHPPKAEIYRDPKTQEKHYPRGWIEVYLKIREAKKKKP